MPEDRPEIGAMIAALCLESLIRVLFYELIDCLINEIR
jgi:hypothetical protein